MKPKLDIIEHDGRGYGKLALISDSHGPINPTLLSRLGDYDCVVHAGDVGGVVGFGDLQNPLVAIRGNNDVPSKWPGSEKTALKNLPECVRVVLTGGDLLVIHGHQFPSAKTRHQKLRSRFANARAIVYGHSHHLVIDEDEKPWVLNPGACGLRRTFGGASYVELRVAKSRWSTNPIRL